MLQGHLFFILFDEGISFPQVEQMVSGASVGVVVLMMRVSVCCALALDFGKPVDLLFYLLWQKIIICNNPKL